MAQMSPLEQNGRSDHFGSSGQKTMLIAPTHHILTVSFSTQSNQKKGERTTVNNTVQQANVTIVQVDKSCRAHRTKHKCPTRRKRRLVPQPKCIQGDIFQPCNGKKTTYFKAICPLPRAIVRIQNDSPCTMHALLYMKNKCTPLRQCIAQGQQICASVPRLTRIVIVCPHPGLRSGICKGKYDVLIGR